MFDIYINVYKNSSGSTISTEKLMFSIPLKDGKCPLVNPIVKSTEDMADSFDFTVESGSEYYDAFIPFKTRFRIKYEDDTIFFGRVLTVNDSTVFQTRSVHCEGCMGYLNDSFYDGVQETGLKEISYSSYLDKIIEKHNSYFSSDEPWKVITKGNIGFTPTSEKRKFEPTGWTETMALLSDLTSKYGGHFRLRCDKDNTKRYLDWYQYFSRDLGDEKRPSVVVTKNIIDISSSADVNNVFTYLIPIGSTNGTGKPKYLSGYKYKDKDGVEHTHSGKALAVTTIPTLYTDNQLNDAFHNASDYKNAKSNYGKIYKTQSFPNANTRAKLWNYAKDWIKKSYFGAVSSFNVRAVDLHIINTSNPKILIGECVDVEYKVKEAGSIVTKKKKLVCSSVQYDLLNPEKTSYVFGIPSTLLNSEYGKRKKQEKNEPITKKTAPSYHYEEPEPTIRFSGIYGMIYDKDNGNPPYYGAVAGDSLRANGEKSGTITAYEEAVVVDAGTGESAKQEFKYKANLVGVITAGTSTPIWVAVCVGGVFAFTDKKNPHKIAHWYTRENAGKYEYGDESTPGVVDEKTGKVDFPSTTGDTQDLNTTTVEIDPNTKNKVNGKDSSQGQIFVGVDLTDDKRDFKVKLNVPIKYTDEKSVDRIKDGFVSASDFNIPSINSFKTKLIVVDQLIADRVTTNQLNAVTGFIEKLNSEEATIDKIAAKRVITNELVSNGKVFFRYNNMSYGVAEHAIQDIEVRNTSGGHKEIVISCYGKSYVSNDFD